MQRLMMKAGNSHIKYPRSVSKNIHDWKGNLVAGVEANLGLIKDQRPEGARLIQKLETDTRKVGIDVDDLAAMIFSLVWV